MGIISAIFITKTGVITKLSNVGERWIVSRINGLSKLDNGTMDRVGNVRLAPANADNSLQTFWAATR